MSQETKLDVVQVLITQYRDRIQLCIPSEVQDIAKDLGITAQDVCNAMVTALDELESRDRCEDCGLLAILHGHDGECPEEETASEYETA